MADERDFAELDFPQVLGEFTSGGVVIFDRFPDRDDDQVAFRTLLQLDGDVLLSIHAEALARADFAELLDNHQKHVCKVLDAKAQRLRRLANNFGIAFGLVGLGAGVSFGGVASYLQSISLEWVIAASGSVGGVLWAARRTLGDFWLRAVLRRWAFARARLRPDV
jgi:hypothetical protein